MIVIVPCRASFWYLSCKNLMALIRIHDLSKMGPPHIQPGRLWKSFENYSRKRSSFALEIYIGQRGIPISPHWTFFLWKYLKSKVYVNRPRTLKALKQGIREEIPSAMCLAVFNHMKTVLQGCFDRNERHLNNIIF